MENQKIMLDPLNLYACILGGIFLLLFAFQIVQTLTQRRPLWLAWLSRHLYRKVFSIFIRYLVYPYILRRSRLWFILQSSYWAGTIVCNFIKARGAPAIAARAGNLAILNFLPLILAERLNLIADLLGIRIRSYTGVHGTFGIMTCMQAALHVILRIRERGWMPGQSTQFYGLLAVSAFSASITLLIIRNWLYEIFIKMHYLLGILALIAIWYHVRLLKVSKSFTQIYLLVGTCTLVVTTVLHWSLLVARNVTSRQFGSRARAHKTGEGTAVVVIPVNRPFTVRAGMIFYIWMPGVSCLSAFSSHPFMIAWWETNRDGKATSISLLIERKTGFTRHLVDQLSRNRDQQYITWIDGPYGGELFNLTVYDQALLFASGIGIASQIPYIREFLELNPEEIFVVWEVDNESSFDWVYQWMDQLLARDKDSKVLHFGLYVRDKSLEAPTVWEGENGRVWTEPGGVKASRVMPRKFWTQSKHALVAVSARQDLRDDLRNVVLSEMESTVDFIELPFQPEELKQGLSCVRS
ncbi:uncharacterized protein BDV17DRAFT_299984 [Aspergillus undulatus]|uniref:uncharacterized protein n=1 Tax=Aspergillus undulatus TaxID=1810928 RepID=UPI003CCDD595